jgi:hypothetical protein
MKTQYISDCYSINKITSNYLASIICTLDNGLIVLVIKKKNINEIVVTLFSSITFEAQGNLITNHVSASAHIATWAEIY